MTGMNESCRGQKAEVFFKEGYSCAQAVFLAFEDVHGMERNTATKLTSAMGGGMGRLREVCGCVSAMFLVLGMIEGGMGPDSSDEAHAIKKKLYEDVQILAGEFRAEHGSIICRELLGMSDEQKDAEKVEPSKRNSEYYRRRPCAKLCSSAVTILQKYLDLTD